MDMERKCSTNTNNDVQEIPEIHHFHEESDDNDNDGDDDALSLCDLPLHGGENDIVGDDNPSDADANFEFSTTKALHKTGSDILFFGKSMSPYKNPLKTSSFSYNKVDQKTASHFHVSATPPPRRSSSVRLPETGKLLHQSSRMKSSPKQYNFHVFIGFAAKFDPPRMELGEMRKRQSRKAPSPMFAGFGGEQSVIGGGEQRAVGGGEPGDERGSGKGHWGGFLRPLRFRSNLLSALTRASFRCVRHV